MHFFVSIAHSASRKGASSVIDGKRYTEYDLSKLISRAVVEMLQNDGYDITLVRSSTLHTKTDTIKRLAKKYKAEYNYLAIEIHFNSATAKGTCTLYRTDSEFSKDCAKIMQEVLIDELERGVYLKAKYVDYMDTDSVIPFPSDFRHTRSGNQFKLGFFEYLKDSDGECPAILIEVDGIRAAQWAAQNIDTIAEAVAIGLIEVEAMYGREDYE